jgi:DNA-directed RNA polymerase specialized sigma24 family protein
MASRGLSGEAFKRLLDHLDADQVRAGERYEELRRTLLAFFEWRGAPFPDEHADETLDRTARKIVEGQEIRNIRSYCYTVAKLILLETLKGPDSRRTTLDATDIPATDRADNDRDKEAHLVCLDGCLGTLPEESRALIIEYYRDDSRGRIGSRRALAQRMGLKPEALANRAQRLRDKLERCVTACLGDMNTVSRHH